MTHDGFSRFQQDNFSANWRRGAAEVSWARIAGCFITLHLLRRKHLPSPVMVLTRDGWVSGLCSTRKGQQPASLVYVSASTQSEETQLTPKAPWQRLPLVGLSGRAPPSVQHAVGVGSV